jgi:hypothetical protein
LAKQKEKKEDRNGIEKKKKGKITVKRKEKQKKTSSKKLANPDPVEYQIQP